MVDRYQPLDAPLHRTRQLVVRSVLIREQGVASGLWYLDRIEHRRSRWNFEIRVVRVEIRSGIRQPDRLAILLPIGQNQDVRVRRMMELVDHVRLGRAEATREGHVSRRREGLATHHEELSAEERLLELREGGVGKRLPKVDACSLQSECGGEWAELHQLLSPSNGLIKFNRPDGWLSTRSRPAAVET